jgi:Transglutaminase-like superfamily
MSFGTPFLPLCFFNHILESATMRKGLRLISGIGRKFVTRPGEAFLLFQMAWWVAVLSVTARFYSLPRALHIVAGREKSKQSSPQATTQDELARAIDLLLSADVLMFKPICWKRAAVLHRYLSRNGINTRIIFGVRNETGGKVAGHAWLEADGKPILESSPPDYVVTYSFPSKERFDPQLTWR